MGSVCLSSASILRCSPTPEPRDNFLLVIPTALEVIFTSSLIFAKWGQGRRHLLLTAEGWIYLILTVIELISNVPTVRSNFSLFRDLDLGIGVASFLPIFFYTFFLYIFTSEELTDTLPKRLQNVAKLSLIIFIPAIVIFNEVASFIGVSIRPDSSSKPKPNIVIGFANSGQEGLWTFFTSLTLALLIIYQASVFCFSFFRLTRALLNQRNIERRDSDKAHLVNGIGWIAGSAKLGALETVIGFAGGSFGMSLTRRIMRMLSRAFMCIGIVKGVDMLEDFQAVQDEIMSARRRKPTSFRKSRLRNFISNPRYSTFRQLSPTATAFHATPRAPQNLVYIDEKADSYRGPHYITTSQRQSQSTLQSGLPGMEEFASIKERMSKNRVTITYNRGTPKLTMRFSSLSIPSPALVAQDIKSRPLSTWYAASSEKSRYTHSSYYFDSDKKSLSEMDLIRPPVPRFHTEKELQDRYRDSLNSFAGPYEIINAPQRKLSQRAAQARIYQAPRSIHNASPENMVAMPVAEPTSNPVPEIPQQTFPTTTAPVSFPGPEQEPELREHSTVADSRRTTEDFGARVKSMASIKSMPDSIKAVRELASQFPGPPSPFEYKPGETVLTPRWEVESGPASSVLYPPGIMARPRVIGSPSEFTFRRPLPSPLLKSSAFVGGSEDGSSQIAISPVRYSLPSPVKAGKTPVMQPGDYRMSITPRGKGMAPYNQKPIDPFDENDSRMSYASMATVKPSKVPLRLNTRSSVLSVPPSKTRKAEVPETPQGITPGTVESNMSGFELIAKSIAEDPFIDLGTALDSGRSKQFRLPGRPPSATLPPMPVPPVPKGPRSPTTPRTTTPRKTVSVHEKLSRIAEWVDTSASVAVAPDDVQLSPPAARRENNLQNLHDRGKSIDNLEIPWLRNPRMAEQNERRLARANGSNQKPELSRLKSVGRVPSKPTPTPMRSAHSRGSFHLLPIVIPPRAANMQAIQVEVGSLESRPGGTGVLRDSEVLAMEDSLPTTQR
uniref:Uncharacterized protein n=1 Tax=Psilocybe cubensis TaxID=181762 RepID=A0A8H7XS23_PSICU